MHEFLSANTSWKAAPEQPGRRVCRTSGDVYLVTLYVLSPAAFLEDSMLCPPLLPSMLTNPRTVCFCHPVACMESTSKCTRGEG